MPERAPAGNADSPHWHAHSADEVSAALGSGAQRLRGLRDPLPEMTAQDALTPPPCRRTAPDAPLFRGRAQSTANAGARTTVTGTGLCSSSACATDPSPPSRGALTPRAPTSTASQP